MFAVAGLYVLQRIGSTQEGNASFSLSGDYYNRELSGRTHLRFRAPAHLCVHLWVRVSSSTCVCLQAGSPSWSPGPASSPGSSRRPDASTLLDSRWPSEPSRGWTSTSPVCCWVGTSLDQNQSGPEPVWTRTGSGPEPVLRARTSLDQNWF